MLSKYRITVPLPEPEAIASPINDQVMKEDTIDYTFTPKNPE